MPSTSDVADIRAAERDRYDRCWKNQVVYCLDVETFLDADGDGVGDFQGLVNRADYLEELGIDCVWLMPFYPSAQLDAGYDVTDYLVRRHADPVRKRISPRSPQGCQWATSSPKSCP